MKRIVLAVLLLFSALSWAGSEPKLADYTINVHVIDGKKYELRSVGPNNAVLGLGDHEAKLIRDEHKTTYDSSQVYEFLFPDNKTRAFEVIGVTE